MAYKIVHTKGFYFRPASWTLEQVVSGHKGREFRVYQGGQLVAQVLGYSVEVYEYINGVCVGTY